MKHLNLFLFLFVFACSEDDADDFNYSIEKFNDCHNPQNWDEESISEALIGEWKWKYISCFWVPEDANGNQHSGLTIEFSENNILNVFDDGDLFTTTSWSIVPPAVSTSYFYKIETEEPIEQLNGRIQFCNDKVVFANSFIDGCDNFFKRSGNSSN